MKFLNTILLIVLVISFKPLEAQVQLETEVYLSLEKDFNNYSFSASEDYLVWRQGYTDIIFIQNLRDQTLHELKPSEGRGPFEILNLRGIEIIDQQLVLYDISQLKILVYSLADEEFIEEFLLGSNQSMRGSRIIYLGSSNNKLYGKGFSMEGVLFKVDLKEKNLRILPNTNDEGLMNDAIKNLYRFDMPAMANEGYFASIRQYEPEIFIYNFETKELSDFAFDETQIKTKYRSDEFGFASLPEKISARFNDSFIHPNKNIIYFVANGSTEKLGSLNKNTIYRYDFVNKKYLEPLVTTVENIKHITTNGINIFIYSEEEYLIYKANLE